jgi:peptide/nickel transport system permease protein
MSRRNLPTRNLRWTRGERVAMILLMIILLLTILAGLIAPFDPNEMTNDISQAPSFRHIFGTDTLGRDILSRVLYGGRASLWIGIVATLISTVIAIVYGTITGLVGPQIDYFLMRICDLLLSLPQILMIVFLQAIMGTASIASLSLVVGISGWMGIARITRNEVQRLRGSDYILSAKLMGATRAYILKTHLLPNLLPAILYPIVSNVGSAMVAESTLSFMGLGLPVDVPSWGGILSGAQQALLAGQWWMIVLPGGILIVTLVCIAEVGEQFRRSNTRVHSNL